jgi:hypothetical protein
MEVPQIQAILLDLSFVAGNKTMLSDLNLNNNY